MKKITLLFLFALFSKNSTAVTILENRSIDDAIREAYNLQPKDLYENMNFHSMDGDHIYSTLTCGKGFVDDQSIQLRTTLKVEIFYSPRHPAVQRNLSKNKTYNYAIKKAKLFEETGNIPAMQHWSEKAYDISMSEALKLTDNAKKELSAKINRDIPRKFQAFNYIDNQIRVLESDDPKKIREFCFR